MKITLQKDLTPIKEAAKLEVDAAAEAYRLKWITPGSGQAMVYQEKAAQARAVLAGEPGTYPLIEAEIGITGDTAEEVAQIVLATAAQWTTIAAAIEATRLATKRAIDQATSEHQIKQLVEDLSFE